MQKRLIGLTYLLVLLPLLSCVSSGAKNGSSVVEPPTSIVGKWKAVLRGQTYILTYHEDSTYTMEMNSRPLEVGTYSFTDTQITTKPTYAMNRYSGDLQQVPDDAETVVVDYEISGNQMVQKGYGTFTYLGK